MVITNIIGGLGNQMFQYAVGQAISLMHGVPLRLDISCFSSYGLHQGFELHRIFNCSAEIANETDVFDILGWQGFSPARRILLRRSMAGFRCDEFVVEPYFRYWNGILNVPSNCYITGYWQSEAYFLEVAERIRAEFTFKLPLENKNVELEKQIRNGNAVSLHVRRGDYVNNPKTAESHGLCSLSYYQAAIRHIAERVKSPFFYVFSDDIAWVKEHLIIDFPHRLIDQNHGIESYNDMRLMALCKHHIIANSSFSWWGAWLNPNVEKVVVAPKNWFANQTDVNDLLPQNWVKL